MTIIHSADEFDKALISNKVVLVDFWATWCGPCRMLMPVIEEVAAEAEGKFAVLKVDVDENEQLAMRYKIMTIPTLMVFKNGVAEDKSIGVVPKTAIMNMVEKYL